MRLGAETRRVGVGAGGDGRADSLRRHSSTPTARAWVDRTHSGFDPPFEELAGQLVIEWIPGGYVSPSSPDFEPLRAWVAEDDRIGGVSPSIGTPHAYVAKLNALQERADVPLLVTADFENGGPGMRINGSFALPSMLPAREAGHDFPADDGVRRHRR